MNLLQGSLFFGALLLVRVRRKGAIWMGLKIKQEGQTAGFGPRFHLPGFYFGTGFSSHSHMKTIFVRSFLKVKPVSHRFDLESQWTIVLDKSQPLPGPSDPLFCHPACTE